MVAHVGHRALIVRAGHAGAVVAVGESVLAVAGEVDDEPVVGTVHHAEDDASAGACLHVDAGEYILAGEASAVEDDRLLPHVVALGVEDAGHELACGVLVDDHHLVLAVVHHEGAGGLALGLYDHGLLPQRVSVLVEPLQLRHAVLAVGAGGAVDVGRAAVVGGAHAQEEGVGVGLPVVQRHGAPQLLARGCYLVDVVVEVVLRGVAVAQVVGGHEAVAVVVEHGVVAVLRPGDVALLGENLSCGAIDALALGGVDLHAVLEGIVAVGQYGGGQIEVVGHAVAVGAHGGFIESHVAGRDAVVHGRVLRPLRAYGCCCTEQEQR